MAFGLNYSTLHLPEDLSTILEKDFWLMESIGPTLLRSLSEPVKFAATTWIFLLKGECHADINLVRHELKAPALVSIKSSHIMQPTFFSEDFEAAVMVMSSRFSQDLFMYLGNSPITAVSARHPVVTIPEETLPHYLDFIRETRSILSDTANPYARKALMHHILLFIHRYGYKSYEPFAKEITTRHGRISEQFLLLVQKHGRSERFLDFYASKLEVTPKHLSRTVKQQTGYTAVEWIEKHVILEAKVLLRSSNLNIQQIADELNFPSQSFFGKYFKKLTGMSPKEFRNS